MPIGKRFGIPIIASSAPREKKIPKETNLTEYSSARTLTISPIIQEVDS